MRDHNLPQEAAFRSAVLAGDQAAWEAWYHLEFAPLERYVLWRCGNLRDLADDVLQETWLTAIRRIRWFDPAAGRFHGWLCGIAGNVIRNLLRQRRRRLPLEEAVGAVVSNSGPAEEEACPERIASALAALPERYERVLRAKYLEQQSVAQIAESSGESLKAIESLLSRTAQHSERVITRGRKSEAGLWVEGEGWRVNTLFCLLPSTLHPPPTT